MIQPESLFSEKPILQHLRLPGLQPLRQPSLQLLRRPHGCQILMDEENIHWKIFLWILKYNWSILIIKRCRWFRFYQICRSIDNLDYQIWWSRKILIKHSWPLIPTFSFMHCICSWCFDCLILFAQSFIIRITIWW